MYIKSPINSFFNLYHLKKYIKDIDGFISGGCFKNVFKHQKIRDIDIFFRNQDDFDKAVKFYSSNYKKMFENDNCIAFSDHKNGMQIELVRSIFGTPEEITDNFDFTIVKASLVKTEVNKFTNTVKEHFSQNSSVKYLTLFLILILIALILYCLLNDKLNL